MAQVELVGKVTTDPDLKQSVRGTSYVRFGIVEWIGSSANRRGQFFQVCVFGDEAEMLIRGGVQKDSFICVKGMLELEEYTSEGGRFRDKRMKIYLKEWNFASDDPGQNRPKHRSTIPCAAVIDGERDPLPE